MPAAITLNFRKAHLTIACVNSLIADGWDPILIWDNSANDGADARILRDAFCAESRVHVEESPANLGFAAGVNRAVEWLDGRGRNDAILLINNDARIAKGARDVLCSAIREAGVALVAPQVEQDGKIQGWTYYHSALALVGYRHYWGGFSYLSGCCLLVNREIIRGRVFDEDFFMYGEDVELSYRMLADGLRLMLVSQVLATHIGAAGSGQSSPFYEWHLVRAHWLLASKLSSGLWGTVLFRTIRLPVLAVRAIVRSIRYRSLAPVHALSALLPGRRA